MRTFSLTVATVAALASQANAFWGTAHMLVSRYAQILLEEQSPAVLEAALADLTPLQQSNPSLTTDEGNHPFTECANFADNIKGMGYDFQADWHFFDQPYYDEGGSAEDYDFVEADYIVVDALTALTAFIRGDSGASSSPYVQQIASYMTDEADQISFALRLVIHYVGDIHQPLHVTAEVDSHYPSGDKGGNKEDVPSHDGAYNLHAVWDSVMYEYTGYPRVPLHNSDWVWYTMEAEDLATNYPVNESLVYPQEFQTWADEGLQVSIADVYPGFVEDQDLTDSYIETALGALRPRIVYGGRRLAELMMYIYGDEVKFLQQ